MKLPFPRATTIFSAPLPYYRGLPFCLPDFGQYTPASPVRRPTLGLGFITLALRRCSSLHPRRQQCHCFGVSWSINDQAKAGAIRRRTGSVLQGIAPLVRFGAGVNGGKRLCRSHL